MDMFITIYQMNSTSARFSWQMIPDLSPSIVNTSLCHQIGYILFQIVNSVSHVI